MKIYLDTCCYGRPYDDHSEMNTKAESEAVLSVIDVCRSTGIAVVGSPALMFELGKIPDAELRGKVEAFCKDTVNEWLLFTATDDSRARALQADNIGVMDSYHLAAAEHAGADFLITTDRVFLNRATNKNLSIVNVVNPTIFLPEVTKWER